MVDRSVVADTGITAMAGAARVASRALAELDGGARSRALLACAAALEARAAEILTANGSDVDAARGDRASPAIVDRLTLTEPRIAAMAEAARSIAALPDPIGTILEAWTLPNGLEVEKVRVPLGVIGVIYEGRPNVTVDAAALAVKAGSAVLLRGSRIARHSNEVLARILQEAGQAAGLPPGTIQSAPPTRESAGLMMRARGAIDLLIPRGGADLIETVVRESLVPVIETGVGNCHVYVDAAADLDQALAILVNAKVQRPGVCNAAESFLVHRAVAAAFVPRAVTALTEHGVEVVADQEIRDLALAAGAPPVGVATDEDHRSEFLGLKISGRVVGSVEEAIEHVNAYGTKHTEAIVTRDEDAARRFAAGVDAAAVMINASTRFTDGGEFGMGAEIGISTQKLHARGPMGLAELTTYKFVVRGTGQTRT